MDIPIITRLRLLLVIVYHISFDSLHFKKVVVLASIPTTTLMLGLVIVYDRGIDNLNLALLLYRIIKCFSSNKLLISKWISLLNLVHKLNIGIYRQFDGVDVRFASKINVLCNFFYLSLSLHFAFERKWIKQLVPLAV